MSTSDLRDVLERAQTALDDAFHELDKVEQEAADTAHPAAGAPWLSRVPVPDVAGADVAATAQVGESTAQVQVGAPEVDPQGPESAEAPATRDYNPGAAEDTGA